ncbi:MAG: glutathione synthase, partial [Planctomycetota bacterium]
MKLGIVVNDIRTEEAGYTTSRLAIAALNRGHDVWTISVGDLAYDPDDVVRARARRAPKSTYSTTESYVRDLQGRQGVQERISVDALDVLLLRNDPAQDVAGRPWAAHAAIMFGRIALRHGVIVLNDPNGLSKATNKMYFQTFPEEVRPKTLITRDRDEIKDFARDQ